MTGTAHLPAMYIATRLLAVKHNRRVKDRETETDRERERQKQTEERVRVREIEREKDRGEQAREVEG